MTRVCTRLFAAVAAVVLLAGCQVEKSANPLSPALAGPVEGVVISHPNLLEPGQDWELKTRDQPVQLLIQNADTSGARPLKYTFEIAIRCRIQERHIHAYRCRARQRRPDAASASRQVGRRNLLVADAR